MNALAKELLVRTHLYEPTRASMLWIRRPEWWKRERRKLRFFGDLVPRGSLCFDIGANVGEYLADLLAVGAGRVVAVEPQAKCVRELSQRFASDPRVTLVPKAMGAAEGSVRMYASDSSQIASCSTEWVNAVKASGRFSGHVWTAPVEVPMTTLDKLIAEHGHPAFCKIDVEGFELNVLRGLSTPIAVVSFEFSPETIDRACDCVRRLAEIGECRFNYCPHGHMEFGLDSRAGAEEFERKLRHLPPQAMKWGGDVYAWSTGGHASAAAGRVGADIN